MPTYDYQCRSCGTVTEVIHAMTADGPSVCERCGGELRRVLYPAGIIFKGSGFYRTDSRAASTASDGGGSQTPSTKPKEGSAAGDAPSSSKATGSDGSTSSGDSAGTKGTAGGESAA